MIERKYLNPKNDVAFRKIFGTEDHKDLLISFLNSILNFEGEYVIETVEFLNPFQAPVAFGYKQSIVDILCKDKRNIRYIVEMHVARTHDFEKRAQYYCAKTYIGQLEKGEDYPKLNKVILLAISDHVLFDDIEHFKSNHLILDTKTHKNKLKDFSFTFIVLPKFHKTEEQLETLEDKWIYFLKYADKEIEVPRVFQGTPIEKAYHSLERYMWNEQEMLAYGDASLAVVDYEHGIEGAKAEGKAEGILEERLNLARTFYKQGINLDFIITSTGLTKEQILN